MKNLIAKHIAFGAFLLFILPVDASAQVPVTAEKPLVNQYMESGELPRKATWWNLLGRELSYSIDEPYDEVSVSELQNIIFFASNHKDKVKPKDALPSLISVLEYHENEQYRIMAITAIHAIGDRNAMLEVSNAMADERSLRVRRHAKAAVEDYFDFK